MEEGSNKKQQAEIKKTKASDERIELIQKNRKEEVKKKNKK
jgi:hypothetical protein